MAPTPEKKQNPYVGPRPFERGERARFFGRDTETQELISLIIAHRNVVLYAESGAGKTSLLNAQVVPFLEDEGFEVLPFARVQGPVPPGIDLEDIPNIYAFHTLLSWAKDDVDPQELTRQSLAGCLTDRPQKEDKYGFLQPRILIFDQFEELFTAYPDRWHDREGFFNLLVKAMQVDLQLRIVFSLREDYVAELEAYADLMPKQLRNRFRLERMRPGQALIAVRGPLEGTGKAYAPAAAEQLVTELRKIRVQAVGGKTRTVVGEFVEPVQLQVVCQNLWEDLPADVDIIDSDHLQRFGNISQALATFYERALRQTTEDTNVNEETLRDWFEKTLITPAGTRGTVYRDAQETGGIPNEAVQVLENSHVLRGEFRAGARWYELTHDRLIEPVQDANRLWREQQRERRFKTVRRVAIGLAVILILVILGLWASAGWRQDNLEEAAVEVAQQQVQQTSTSSANLIATQNAELEQIKVTGTASARETAAAAQATEELLIATATAEAATRMANDAKATAEAATRLANDAKATVEAATRTANDAKATESAYALMEAQAEVRRLALARPLLPGVSISGESSETGSLTVFVKDDIGDIYLLTQMPVLGGPGAATGAPILQPGLSDNGNIISDTVATLVRIPDLNPSNVAGLALLQDGQSYAASVPGLGPIRGIRPPADRMNIVVIGRGSGPVPGYLVENDTPQQTQIANATYRIIFDDDQPGALTPGALVVDKSGYAVGMVAVQNEGESTVLPLLPILNEFQVSLIYIGEQLHALQARLAVNDVDYSSTGIIAAGGDDFLIKLWKGDDLTNHNLAPLEILSGHNNHVLALAFTPDGNLLASGSRDNNIIIWSTGAVGEEPSERLHVLSEHFNVVRSLAFSSDGRQLASTGADNRILLWDATDFTSKPFLLSSRSDPDGHSGNITDLAYHPQLPMLASSGEDETVRFWYFGDDGAFPRVKILKTDHRDDVNAIAFSPDGQFMATASSDRTVRLWDLSEFLNDSTQDPILQASLTNHGSLVLDVDFSSNGATLASASSDSLVRLWDVRNLNIPPIVMEGHRDFVYALNYGPEGLGLASAGSDATVRIWEVRTLFEPE